MGGRVAPSRLGIRPQHPARAGRIDEWSHPPACARERAQCPVAQLVAHHASNGCNLRAGDLLGSGTISSEGAYGSLLEISRGGREPITLASGETRRRSTPMTD